MEDKTFKDLHDKVCVITGGGGVLGSSMAMGLASVGVRCVILDIDESAAQQVAAEVKKKVGE